MKTINQVVRLTGTAAERAALTDAAVDDNTIFEFTETDTGDQYEWDGNSWTKVAQAGSKLVAAPYPTPMTTAQRDLLDATTIGSGYTIHNKTTGNDEVYRGDSVTNNTTDWEDANAEIVSRAVKVTQEGQIAGERNVDSADAYMAAVPECSYTSVTADTDISTSGPALVFGVLVTVTTATNIIEIRDSNAAGAGTVVLSIPAATAAGTYYPLFGAKFNTGLYADFTGTGTLVVFWRGQ